MAMSKEERAEQVAIQVEAARAMKKEQSRSALKKLGLLALVCGVLLSIPVGIGLAERIGHNRDEAEKEARTAKAIEVQKAAIEAEEAAKGGK